MLVSQVAMSAERRVAVDDRRRSLVHGSLQRRERVWRWRKVRIASSEVDEAPHAGPVLSARRGCSGQDPGEVLLGKPVEQSDMTDLRMSRVTSNIADHVGRTPMVRMDRLAPEGVELYGKLESLNPGGSVKDRIGV